MAAAYSLAEVQKHNVPGDLWMVVHDKVYDLSTFAEEHPGGEEAIYDEAGRDASGPFEDIGHSDEARELLEKYYIGDLITTGMKAPVPVTQIPESKPKRSSSLLFIVPAIVVAGAILYKFAILQQK